MSFSNRAAVSPKQQSVSPGKSSGPHIGGHSTTNGATGRVDVDTFIPDEGDFDNFLDEADSVKERSVMAVNNVDSR